MYIYIHSFKLNIHMQFLTGVEECECPSRVLSNLFCAPQPVLPTRLTGEAGLRVISLLDWHGPVGVKQVSDTYTA